MNSRTYAASHWITDRQSVIAEIEKQVDELFEGRTSGAFICDIRGPYGSRNSNTKELPAASSQ